MVTLAPQPDPSLVESGSLYVDAQSRAIWLGVSEAMDPNRSILVSDIQALVANDTATLDAANAYTDVQVATRAPVAHTHTSSQITDFTSAVTGVVAGIPGLNWVRGMILLWSGSAAEIGVEPLAGWSLCDGGNGTPDLRDRFVIGAGNKEVGPKDPLVILETSQDPGHTHEVNPTTLTIAQMPEHRHSVSLSGNTGDESRDHSHPIPVLTSTAPGFTGLLHTVGSGPSSINTNVNNLGHTHTVSLSGNTGYVGGDTSHTHTTKTNGVHKHTVTTNDLREAIPYYALCYIMKL